MNNSDTKKIKCPQCGELKDSIAYPPNSYAREIGNDPNAWEACNECNAWEACNECAE